MSNQPQSAHLPNRVRPQPQLEDGNAELDDIERELLDDEDPLEDDAPVDDPGDAQRSSKSEPDGDGEEQLR